MKPVKLRLKIDLVSYPARAEGLDKYEIMIIIIRLKENEKADKYLDLARELKKKWSMKVTIIPIVIGAFGTVSKGLFKGVEDLEFGGPVEAM